MKTGIRVIRGSGHSNGKLCCFLKVNLRRKAILCLLRGSWFGNRVRRNIIRRAEDRHSGHTRVGSFERKVTLFFEGQFAPESYFMSIARRVFRERNSAEHHSAGWETGIRVVRVSSHSGGKLRCFWGVNSRREAILCPLRAGCFGNEVQRNIIRRAESQQLS